MTTNEKLLLLADALLKRDNKNLDWKEAGEQAFRLQLGGGFVLTKLQGSFYHFSVQNERYQTGAEITEDGVLTPPGPLKQLHRLARDQALDTERILNEMLEAAQKWEVKEPELAPTEDRVQKGGHQKQRW